MKWVYHILFAFVYYALLFAIPTDQARLDIFRAPDALAEQQSGLVTWDEYSIFVRGERILLLSGEFHPFRLPSPGLWLDVFQKIRALGYSGVSFYLMWGLLEGAPGRFRSDGVFDLQVFFDAASQAGIYLIARPGPYINAEVSGGGLPGWLQRLRAGVRSVAPDYLNATSNYIANTGKIISRAQVTNGGPVILFQPENEYTMCSGFTSIEEISACLDKNYMFAVEKQYREAGIVVPFISNDAVPLGNWAPGTGRGAVDIYGYDDYPFGWGTGCQNPYNWTRILDPLILSNFSTHLAMSPKTPYAIIEYQGGAPDPWGGEGVSTCAAMISAEFARVFYKVNFSLRATVVNLYMMFGGTNWGNLGYPSGYTSYDVGAPISEDRLLTRQKYHEIKLQGQFMQSSPAYMVSQPLPASRRYSNASNLVITVLLGDTTKFYTVRHADYGELKSTLYHINLDTSLGHFTVPVLGGSLVLNGRDSKIHVTDYRMGDVSLVYSSAEIYTWKRSGSKMILLMYGGEAEQHEFAVSLPYNQVKIEEGNGTTYRGIHNGTIVQWTVSADRQVISFGDKLEVYLLLREHAYNYWVVDLPLPPPIGLHVSPSRENSSVILKGGYLIRNATISNRVLSLTGDLNATTEIEVIAAPPACCSGLTFNRKSVETSVENGRLKGLLKYEAPGVALPNLAAAKWQYLDSLPELSSRYDDSSWTLCNHHSTKNPRRLTTPTSLYASDYGYHAGSILYRGHFVANGAESSFSLSSQGGYAFAHSVWLNSTFLGAWPGSPAVQTYNQTLHFPNRLESGSSYVLTVLIDHMGLDANFYANLQTMKAPRGLLDYSLSSHEDKADITWRMTGNYEGERTRDLSRGPLNEGATFAERQGFHLPGAPSQGWQQRSPMDGMSGPGVGFFATTFNLSFPHGYDIPTNIIFTNSSAVGDPTAAGRFRISLYVNGWQFGKYGGKVIYGPYRSKLLNLSHSYEHEYEDDVNRPSNTSSVGVMFIFRFGPWVALTLTFAVCCSSIGTNDQFSRDIDPGTFQNPSAVTRPRFRYWLPDPSVDEQVMRDDIKSAGDVGAGGIEYLPWYNAGGFLGPAPPGDDWGKYGVGTAAFNKLFQAALETHRDAGMVMDFAIGPNQGQGVPAASNEEGLQWDLVPFSVPVPANGSFAGIIPGWGTGDLLALISAEVVNRTDNYTTLSSVRVPHTRLVLKESSLADRTAEVSATGHLSFTYPRSPENPIFWLFAFYQRLTKAQNLIFFSNQTEAVVENGAYMVDHFSSRGAEVVIDFWEKYVLTENVRSLLSEVGNYAWEDSVEIKSNISWSKSLPRLFEQKHGYSLIQYLPLIMFGNNNIAIQSTEPGPVECILDTPDEGVGYVNDFRDALVEGYSQYLERLTEWATTDLNVQMSVQPAYNLPMDMEATVPIVNAPECESLGFLDNIDGYRQFSGPAVLAGKRIVSNEIGAVSLAAFQYQVSNLLWSINRAVAGGVNQFVIHGLSYTGNYWATTWPGYTAFSYFYGELWSNKQPAWDHGFADFLQYVGRLQFSQQAGPLKTDIAIYDKQSATDYTLRWHPGNMTQLIDAGYSYSYLSPENFGLPQAYVGNQTLGPDGPAYKALIVYSASNVTYDAIGKMQQFAGAGLPVILVGGDPPLYASAGAPSHQTFAEAISELKRTENVFAVSESELMHKLASLHLEPRIQVRANSTWYTTWRESVSEDVQYTFVYNDGEASTGYLVVSSNKIPYRLDMWTGLSKQILEYQQTRSKTIIPLALEANQTALIAFVGPSVHGWRGSVVHAVETPSTVQEYLYSTNTSDSVELHIAAGPIDQPLVLSDGRNYTVRPDRTAASSFTLDNWSLTAEHWAAPDNLSDASQIASKFNTTYQLDALIPWTQIPGLTNASGLGYYSTSFEWPPRTGSADGAYILIPQVLHTLRVKVNGHQTPPFDYNAPRVDISPYLRTGQNEVIIVAPTVMWNYIRSIFDRIVMAGYPPLISLTDPGHLPGPVDSGLSGTVHVVPYVKWQAKL
ncbi:glycoside hydrolase family 35 protein [Aspergillus affinis]|uniref:glycoside hydrolase family 35 protein n=1 Tax=Aspergillus affinis TaxID=1070780 RepID=UPI0022FDBFC1|nr:putative beta-galactosidase A [Aspergillus affinis]KAI9045309.1 putative beta-galactosidase A [Aspergillus affinis]